MENTDPTKTVNKRKVTLISGIIVLLLTVCVIFPIESSKTSFLEELGYTFLTLIIALLLIMIGLLGKSFFKGLLFLILSSLIGFIFFYFAYPLVPHAFFVAFWLGIPSGIITALIFLILNFYFLKHVKKGRILKQTIIYLLILFLVSVLFGYGGDWYFEITQYFKLNG